MKRHLKKVIATVVAALMACALCLGLFAGCGGSSNTITVEIFCATSDANTNQTLIDKWAAQYKEEHAAELEEAGVEELNVRFNYTANKNDYYDRLNNQISGGSAADIIYVSPSSIKSYAVNDIVLDLTKYVDWSKYAYDGMWSGAIGSFAYDAEDNTVGQTVKSIAANGDGTYTATTEDGSTVGIYAAPKDYSSFGLAYNKNFFSDTLKNAYTNAANSDAYRPADGVEYWDGSKWVASDSYVKIGVTMRYFPYNFYRYSTYAAALAGNDPVAKLAKLNGGYEVTIPGWPGDTYQIAASTDADEDYDTSLGYVTYTYAEYSAMTYAVCWFAQVADRVVVNLGEGQKPGDHLLMTWLNNDSYGTTMPNGNTAYADSAYNVSQRTNNVYGNDQYEGSLYMAAWLLGNDTNFIDDNYSSVDALETWQENADNYRQSTWVSSGNTDSDGDGLVDTFVTEDYGLNSENFVEAYAAFLAYGSDWNANAYFSGSAESETAKGGFEAMKAGRVVFYGVGTWDMQQFNNTAIDKLNVGIMPTPISEDYAIASKVKDYKYEAAYYSNDYTANWTENDATLDAALKSGGNALTAPAGYTRVASGYDPYDDSWTITAQAGSAWRTMMDARQDEWFARMDTVGFALNSDILKDPEWKIAAAADLCAYLAMGEDAQVALTYSGSQISSLRAQCKDYVFYLDNGADAAFAKMISPDGIAANNNTLTVTESELGYVKDYYGGARILLTDEMEATINAALADTTLEGEEIWYFAVGAANYMYDNRRNGTTVETYITARFPSLVDYLNEDYKTLDIGTFAAYGGANMVYKSLNMVSLDKAARNLQVRMAAFNGRQDTSTYTYDSSWIDGAFMYYRNNALIAYNENRDAGAFDLLDRTNTCKALVKEATGQSQLNGVFPTVNVPNKQGHYYTPATYSLTIVNYVQYELGANSLIEELDQIH